MIRRTVFRFRNRGHRGVNTVQTAVVLALITVAIVVTVRNMGQNASTGLNSASAGVADPSKLANEFLP